MKKMGFISILLGIGCFVLYSINGATVLEDGTLQEPFYLLPIGYCLLLAGIAVLIVQKINRRKSY